MKNALKLRKNEKLRVIQSHIISTQAGSDGAEYFTGTRLDSDDSSSLAVMMMMRMMKMMRMMTGVMMIL